MEKLNDLQSIHTYIRKNKKGIFSDIINQRKQLTYLKMLRDTPLAELEEKLNARRPVSNDDRLPLSDFLVSKLEREINQDSELKKVVESETYIWDINPKKVASLFNRIGLTIESAERKIKNQFIFSVQTNTVMARSAATTSISGMEDSVSVFQIKKEESKRDQFLKALREEFNKL